MSSNLIPADKEQCQAMKSNGYNALTLGGKPEMVRCTNKPTVIIQENKVGNDGLIGSMSLCNECLDVAKDQFSKDFFNILLL